MDDLDHQVLRIVEHRHVLGHGEVLDAQLRLDLVERGDVDLERLRDVRRQAFDADRVHRLKDVAVTLLDGGRLAGDVDRDLDLDLLLQVDLVKVDVDRTKAAGVGLDLADQHLLVPAVDREVDQVRSA